MKYINSKGEELDTKDMYPAYIINALDKNIVARVVHGHDTPERLQAIMNVEHLKEELLKRLTK